MPRDDVIWVSVTLLLFIIFSSLISVWIQSSRNSLITSSKSIAFIVYKYCQLSFLRICNIVEKIVLSITSFFIIGIVSISMMKDDINSDRKLIRRKFYFVIQTVMKAKLIWMQGFSIHFALQDFDYSSFYVTFLVDVV